MATYDINGNNLNPEIEEISDISRENVYLDVVKNYLSTDLGSASWLNATGGVDTIYDIFDGLVEDYPTYVSKTVLGKDQTNTFDICEYHFRPETVGYYNTSFGPGTVETKNEVIPPLFLVNGAIHGDEKLGTWIITQFCKKMCESWDTDPTLTFYRWNVQFRVIPIVNPWGFNANVRYQSNNLDINRQFLQSDSYLEANCIEAKILRDWLITYKKIAYNYIDCHTAWAGKDRDVAWLISPDNHLDDMCNSIITTLTRMWKEYYTFITYDGLMGYVGEATYVDPTIYNSQSREYAYYYLGYKNAMTFEIANTVQYNSEVKFGQLTTNMYMDLFVNTLVAFAIRLGACLAE